MDLTQEQVGASQEKNAETPSPQPKKKIEALPRQKWFLRYVLFDPRTSECIGREHRFVTETPEEAQAHAVHFLKKVVRKLRRRKLDTAALKPDVPLEHISIKDMTAGYERYLLKKKYLSWKARRLLWARKPAECFVKNYGPDDLFRSLKPKKRRWKRAFSRMKTLFQKFVQEERETL